MLVNAGYPYSCCCYPMWVLGGTWPPDAKSWLIWKDPDAGKDWGQEEKGTTEDEMVGWHHWLSGRKFEWTPEVGDGQGGLECCGSRGRKELDITEQLNWTDRSKGFPGGSAKKNPPGNAGDVGSIPESGRSPGEGNGNPLQYSCLGIPWAGEPGGLQSMGSQRVGRDLVTGQQEQQGKITFSYGDLPIFWYLL